MGHFGVILTLQKVFGENPALLPLHQESHMNDVGFEPSSPR